MTPNQITAIGFMVAVVLIAALFIISQFKYNHRKRAVYREIKEGSIIELIGRTVNPFDESQCQVTILEKKDGWIRYRYQGKTYAKPYSLFYSNIENSCENYRIVNK